MSLIIARIMLPPAMRALAKYASAELYQLTIIAFCLVCGWMTGYLVRPLLGPQLFQLCGASMPSAMTTCLCQLAHMPVTALGGLDSPMSQLFPAEGSHLRCLSVMLS